MIAHALAAILIFQQAPQPPARAPQPAAEFSRIAEEYQHWRDYAFPESALQQGRPTDATRITDQSLQGIEARHAQVEAFVARLSKLNPSDLPPKERLEYQLLLRDLKEGIEGHQFRAFLMPVSGRSGPQQDVIQMAQNMPFATEADYANYIKRLQATPAAIRDIKALMELGVKEKRVPPRSTLQSLPQQFDAVLKSGLDSLREPIARMPSTIPAERQAALKTEFEAARQAILEALLDMRTYFAKDYLPSCRETVGASDLPNGSAWYDHCLRAHTTTALNAKEIHEIGLKEVARIRAEMMQVIRTTDWFQQDPARATMTDDALFAAFVNYLRTDARFYAKTEEELLARYRDTCKKIDSKLPALFATLPRNTYGVRAIPRVSAPTQTTAYYEPGSARAGHCGWFCANTYALNMRPLYELIPLSLHEAVPGHHLQISLAQEMPDQPEFRRQMGTTAYVEGWALYAERLGIEMGLYENDPYADFGRLLYEMWRSCRLVVDTGLHAFGWTRDQAIDYMKAHTALSELNIVAEVDRYIYWPGQATGYKIGELRIRALRDRAEKALGAKFDLRKFHDMILGSGSLPLDVLEQQADEWIAQQAAK